MSLSPAELYNNFFFLCLVYAVENGGATNILNFETSISLLDNGNGTITITSWNDTSPMPTNAQLQALSLASIALLKLKLEIYKNGTTVPSLPTTTITALGTVPNGTLIYDTTLSELKIYSTTSSSWLVI